LIYLFGVCLMVAIYAMVKFFSRGRRELSYTALEGVVIGLITLGCFVAWWASEW
jgi:hypothetical protein